MINISCIIPVFNGTRFIAEALDSILAQSLPVAEIIVVDDGSTDDLSGALYPYTRYIRVVKQQNQGPAAARNLGIRASTGNYLAFLDADDLWREDKLEQLILKFNRYSLYPPEAGKAVALTSTASVLDLGGVILLDRL